jgi:hypothetical protein
MDDNEENSRDDKNQRASATNSLQLRNFIFLISFSLLNQGRNFIFRFFYIGFVSWALGDSYPRFK